MKQIVRDLHFLESEEPCIEVYLLNYGSEKTRFAGSGVHSKKSKDNAPSAEQSRIHLGDNYMGQEGIDKEIINNINNFLILNER